MAPRCQVCAHPEKWRIELLKAGGASFDSLAEKFSIERTAIFRHWQRHVTPEAKASYLAGPTQLEAIAAKAAAEGDSVLDYLRIVRTTLLGQLAACAEAGDAIGASRVANALVGTLERMGKITGELSTLSSMTNINVALVNSPEFADLQARMLRALAPYPEARAAVVAEYREIDAVAALPAPLPKAVPV